MIDKAVGFWSNGKQVEIVGRKATMRISKRDTYRLVMVCLALDRRWEVLPADWRKHFVLKKKEARRGRAHR